MYGCDCQKNSMRTSGRAHFLVPYCGNNSGLYGQFLSFIWRPVWDETHMRRQRIIWTMMGVDCIHFNFFIFFYCSATFCTSGLCLSLCSIASVGFQYVFYLDGAQLCRHGSINWDTFCPPQTAEQLHRLPEGQPGPGGEASFPGNLSPFNSPTCPLYLSIGVHWT